MAETHVRLLEKQIRAARRPVFWQGEGRGLDFGPREGRAPRGREAPDWLAKKVPDEGFFKDLALLGEFRQNTYPL